MAVTYKTTDEAIKALIAIEKAEEGYLEKKSNKDLDSKTKNAGDANYTKYWRDLAELGLMNQGKNFAGGTSWYWCAGFQTWSFIQAFGTDLTKKLLLHIPYISCANLGKLAKTKKQLFSEPKIGDVALFWNGTRFYHTGLVINVTKTAITTVEGNTNQSKKVIPNGGAVCIKTYTIAKCKTSGYMFFRPDYSLVVGKAIKKETTPSKTTTTTSTSASTTKTTTTKTTTATKTTTKKECVINTVSSALRCRKTASSTGSIIGSFSKGTTVELIEKTTSTWWKVKGKEISGKTITGYSACKYLKEK